MFRAADLALEFGVAGKGAGVVMRSSRLVVALLAVLLVLSIAPVAAQVYQTIDLSPGDTLTVNCPTSLTGVVTSSQSETLNCALVATP